MTHPYPDMDAVWGAHLRLLMNRTIVRVGFGYSAVPEHKYYCTVEVKGGNNIDHKGDNLLKCVMDATAEADGRLKPDTVQTQAPAPVTTQQPPQMVTRAPGAPSAPSAPTVTRAPGAPS